jgi:hypothetical protein
MISQDFPLTQDNKSRQSVLSYAQTFAKVAALEPVSRGQEQPSVKTPRMILQPH